jgi:hypothetical protein
MSMRALIVTTALVAAAALLVPASVRAQSLGEIAAETKEKKNKKPAKTYTEEDLAKTKAPANVMDGVSTGATPDAKPGDKAGGDAGKTEGDAKAAADKAWKDKIKAANDQVATLQKQIDAMQNDLNNNQVDPYSPGRLQLQAKFEETQKQLAAAQANVTDLEDQARRAGVR